MIRGFELLTMSGTVSSCHRLESHFSTTSPIRKVIARLSKYNKRLCRSFVRLPVVISRRTLVLHFPLKYLSLKFRFVFSCRSGFGCSLGQIVNILSSACKLVRIDSVLCAFVVVYCFPNFVFDSVSPLPLSRAR